MTSPTQTGFLIIALVLYYISQITIFSRPLSVSIILRVVNTTVNPGPPKVKQRQILQWNVRDEARICTCPITSPFQKLRRKFLWSSRFYRLQYRTRRQHSIQRLKIHCFLLLVNYKLPLDSKLIIKIVVHLETKTVCFWKSVWCAVRAVTVEQVQIQTNVN